MEKRGQRGRGEDSQLQKQGRELQRRTRVRWMGGRYRARGEEGRKRTFPKRQGDEEEKGREHLLTGHLTTIQYNTDTLNTEERGGQRGGDGRVGERNTERKRWKYREEGRAERRVEVGREERREGETSGKRKERSRREQA